MTGTVVSAISHEPLSPANIQVQGTEWGTVTDNGGSFSLELPPGLYNIVVSYTGYTTFVAQEVLTSAIRPVNLQVELFEQVAELNSVQIESEGFKRTDESPLSIRNFSYAEAQRMPGAVLDLSKAIQSYPGVLPKSTFGYNIVFRGGNSSENAYFLDGIEIPTITHFSVQGASGGPNGLVNLDFVRGVDIYAAAFPASRGDVLSGVMEIHQRDGRSDRLGARVTLGATDYGATIEGPMGEKSNFILSARHSFSQYLLRAVGVPVLPTYTDFQYRQKIKFDSRNEMVLVALGANDIYRLNTDAEESDALLYNVGYIPEGEQQQVTVGVNYKHYLPQSYYNVVVSHTSFNNDADKFKNNTGLESDRLLRYRSGNQTQHFRLEHKLFQGKNTIGYGVSASYQQNNFDLFGYNVRPYGVDTLNAVNTFAMLQYGLFGTFSRRWFQERFIAHAGVRLDAANFASSTANPLEQLSPRIALSYRLTDKLSLNASSGIYYQLPNEVLLAFADSLNRDALTYIQSNQLALGIDYRNADHYRVSIEGFYKGYSNYPFLLWDSISYANAIADYVIVGNQPSASINEGRSYGMELFVQQKLKRDYWWMASYTYNVSEFLDKEGVYRPTVWDSRHYISLTAGKTWRSGWQLGGRWRYSSGTPYTPYDTVASALTTNWEVANRGIFDYDRLNEERLASFHMLDIRIDKRFTFEKWGLNVFIDVQNAYRSQIELLPYLTVVRDENWVPVIDPLDPSRYDVQQINSDTGRTLTSIGVVADF